MNQITGSTSVAEIVRLCPGARRMFDEHGLQGCGGEHGPSEPLDFFAAVHQANWMNCYARSMRRWRSPLPSPTYTRKVCRTTSIAVSSRRASLLF